jgi:predicted metal-dependent HD superfamily phosphohydrolase
MIFAQSENVKLEEKIKTEWASHAGTSPSSKRVIDEVIGCYKEKGRHYHNLNPLFSGLQELDAARNIPGIECLQNDNNFMKIYIALATHDAVYNPKSNDEENVRQSAEMGRKIALELGFDDTFAETVDGIVMTTTYKNEPATRLQEIMQDIDLAILGKDEKIFFK